jgi:hypothetical protein
MSGIFKAIEIESASRRRTGREFELAAETRQGAIDGLLAQLGKTADQAQVDPSRTIVRIDASLWTIVALSSRSEAPQTERPELRRAGAKHKRVR